METKLTGNIQPNNKSPFSWLSKIFKGIKTGWDAVGGVFKKFWKLLCKSKKFSNFAYVKFPKFRKDIWEYAKAEGIDFSCCRSGGTRCAFGRYDKKFRKFRLSSRG